MRLTAPALSAALALTLSGCISVQPVPPPGPFPPPPPPPPPSVGTCYAPPANFVVGQLATLATVEAARRAAGAQIVRTLAPGQVVTMEFAANRLNLRVNPLNVIIDVTCG